jgi:hypothetical protein
MAFQAPSAAPRQVHVNTNISQTSTPIVSSRADLQQSQEWVLFSPSQIGSSTDRTQTSQTVGLSRASEFDSLHTTGRSRLDSETLEEAEEAELDTLDEGLNAFHEPVFPTVSHQSQGPLLPTHDGLGSFQASSPPVLEQLWRHEQYNPKRKHEGHHRRASSIQRRFDAAEEQEAQANEEKRMRIEKWRMDQSRAMLDEVERETRRQIRRQSVQQGSARAVEDILGSTPRQSDYVRDEEDEDAQPFWRRLTRKFIRDIIGIDEPLLSVILGESLPEEALEPPRSTTPTQSLPTIPEQDIDLEYSSTSTWRDRLLQRIARELGVLVHQIAPHPGAFSTYSNNQQHDYAGMPVSAPTRLQRSPSIPIPTPQSFTREPTMASTLTPNFPPTIHDPAHAETWGFEEEPTQPPPPSVFSESTLNLQQEREYWERELDVKMVFRYLRDRITTSSTARAEQAVAAVKAAEDNAKRTAIIRQHHPLVARAQRSPARLRRESLKRRPNSSCASESVKSSRKSIVRSGSSRNYWDLGGSVGSGSLLASGGGWGEV